MIASDSISHFYSSKSYISTGTLSNLLINSIIQSKLSNFPSISWFNPPSHQLFFLRQYWHSRDSDIRLGVGFEFELVQLCCYCLYLLFMIFNQGLFWQFKIFYLFAGICFVWLEALVFFLEDYNRVFIVLHQLLDFPILIRRPFNSDSKRWLSSSSLLSSFSRLFMLPLKVLISDLHFWMSFDCPLLYISLFFSCFYAPCIYCSNSLIPLLKYCILMFLLIIHIAI